MVAMDMKSNKRPKGNKYSCFKINLDDFFKDIINTAVPMVTVIKPNDDTTMAMTSHNLSSSVLMQFFPRGGRTGISSTDPVCSELPSWYGLCLGEIYRFLPRLFLPYFRRRLNFDVVGSSYLIVDSLEVSGWAYVEISFAMSQG